MFPLLVNFLKFYVVLLAVSRHNLKIVCGMMASTHIYRFVLLKSPKLVLDTY